MFYLACRSDVRANTEQVAVLQTFEDERVALSVSTQALLQWVKGTGSDVRKVGVRTMTLFDFPLKPAVRLPQVDPRLYSTFSPR